MKTLKIVVAACVLAILSATTANAQGWLERLGTKAAERMTDRAAKKIEDKVNDAADDAVDESFEAAERIALSVGEPEDAGEIEQSPLPQVADTPYTPTEAEMGFLSLRKGGAMTYESKNGKGRMVGRIRNTVTNIVGGPGAFAVETLAEAFDDRGRPVEGAAIALRVVVKDGVMYVDPKAMFDALPGMEGLQISGVAMKVPSSLAVGQTIDDASVTIKMGMMGGSVTMTDGRVVARETLTTPAGTFDCFKVSQKIRTSMMGVDAETTALTWYARGVGEVRKQSVDARGQVVDTQELVEIR